ncbi:hypothetical protein TNCV_3216081 [Trichonephila clavipes]|nr:hypothetical protein TNCV_3216081 [Trichonephila clavipes]
MHNGGPVVAYHASIPQVRDSILGLGKVDSAFHLFSGSINEYQACLETKHWGFHFRLTPDRDICSCSSEPKVMYTEMGTVGFGPHGLLHH